MTDEAILAEVVVIRNTLSSIGDRLARIEGKVQNLPDICAAHATDVAVLKNQMGEGPNALPQRLTHVETSLDTRTGLLGILSAALATLGVGIGKLWQ
jgi:hypothetical protein